MTEAMTRWWAFPRLSSAAAVVEVEAEDREAAVAKATEVLGHPPASVLRIPWSKEES